MNKPGPKAFPIHYRKATMDIYPVHAGRVGKLIGVLCPSPQEFLQAEIAFISDNPIK